LRFIRAPSRGSKDKNFTCALVERRLSILNRHLSFSTLTPPTPRACGAAAVEEICATIDRDRLTASRKILTFLRDHADPSDCGRRPPADPRRRDSPLVQRPRAAFFGT